jgi:perosamine synthetase
LKPIPVNTPDLTDQDRTAVIECLASGWISSEGPQVSKFEREFARAVGRNVGIAVSSGTAALSVAVRALGLGPGDEVLMPSLTIISCAHAVVESGATPVPVDCDGSDWNAHLRHFEARLSPRTRAVMLVHLYGLCGDLDPILAWARVRRLLVIEDASQALGLRYKERRCGSFGDVSVFSLYANKLVTTGEGGMVLCDSDRLANQCRRLRNLCFDPAKRFWHEDLGWNYRLTALQAALGISQLRRIDDLVARKRSIGERYRGAFEPIEWFGLAPFEQSYTRNCYWVFGLVLHPNAPFSRDELIATLKAENIDTRTFFYGLHEQPALLSRRLIEPVVLPETESLSRRGLYLPSGLGLSGADQRRVIDAVLAFAGRYS